MSDNITTFCNTVMRAVVASGAVHEGNIDFASEVMRREVKAFFYGVQYKNERDVALRGHVQLAVTSLVATCVAEIAQAAKAA